MSRGLMDGAKVFISTSKPATRTHAPQTLPEVYGRADEPTFSHQMPLWCAAHAESGGIHSVTRHSGFLIKWYRKAIRPKVTRDARR